MTLFAIEHCELTCLKIRFRVLRFEPKIDICPFPIFFFQSICAAICNGPVILSTESDAQ